MTAMERLDYLERIGQLAMAATNTARLHGIAIADNKGRAEAEKAALAAFQELLDFAHRLPRDIVEECAA